MNTTTFDLEKALAGDPIVTTSGLKLVAFRERSRASDLKRYKYCASTIEGTATEDGGKVFSFDKYGKCMTGGGKFNLLMVTKHYPFNLEAALGGCPLITRSGEKVIGFDHRDSDSDSAALFIYKCDIVGMLGEKIYDANGKYNIGGIEHPLDLFMLEDTTPYIQTSGKSDKTEKVEEKGCDLDIDKDPSEIVQESMAGLISRLKEKAQEIIEEDRNELDRQALMCVDQELLMITAYGPTHTRVRSFQLRNSEILERGYALKDD